MDSSQADAGLHGGACAHDGGSHHAGGAGEDQCRTVVALSGEREARMQQRAHAARLYEHIVGVMRLDSLRVEVYVEQLPFSDYVGVLLEEEGKAGKLEGEGEVGVHHVAMQHIGVPFAEEAGGDVEGDYVCSGIVDILCQSGEATLQGLLESASEETVDYYIVLSQVGGSEFAGYLCEVYSIDCNEFLALFVAIVREFPFDVEEEYFDISVSAFDKESGYGEGVAAVVAGAGHDYDSLSGHESGDYFVAGGVCGTLHQFERVYVLGFTSSIINLVKHF